MLQHDMKNSNNRYVQGYRWYSCVLVGLLFWLNWKQRKYGRDMLKSASSIIVQNELSLIQNVLNLYSMFLCHTFPQRI